MTHDTATIIALAGIIIVLYGTLAYTMAGARRFVAAMVLGPGLIMLAIGCYYAAVGPATTSGLAMPQSASRNT